MTKQDWIILRLLIEIDKGNGFYNPESDSIKAVLYLTKKYGNKKIIKNMKILLKEKLS